MINKKLRKVMPDKWLLNNNETTIWLYDKWLYDFMNYEFTTW